MIESWRNGQIGDKANTVKCKLENICDVYMGVHCIIILAFFCLEIFHNKMLKKIKDIALKV